MNFYVYETIFVTHMVYTVHAEATPEFQVTRPRERPFGRPGSADVPHGEPAARRAVDEGRPRLPPNAPETRSLNRVRDGTRLSRGRTRETPFPPEHGGRRCIHRRRLHLRPLREVRA